MMKPGRPGLVPSSKVPHHGRSLAWAQVPSWMAAREQEEARLEASFLSQSHSGSRFRETRAKV